MIHVTEKHSVTKDGIPKTIQLLILILFFKRNKVGISKLMFLSLT
jgi:hypothetical protein